MDDVFNVIALLCMVGSFATSELNLESEDDATEMKTFIAAGLLRWTSLYSIKASFLALIWIVFNISTGFRKAWWAVTIYTVLTFWATFLSEWWQCRDPLDYANPSACSEFDFNFGGTVLILSSMRFALHISSNLLILILPMAQIRKLQLSRSKKIGIVAIFAIIVIDIIGGVLRNAFVISSTLNEGETPALAWLSHFWYICEPALAVAVCTLPVYRGLFIHSKRRKSTSQREGLRDEAADTDEKTSGMLRLTRTAESEISSFPRREGTYFV